MRNHIVFFSGGNSSFAAAAWIRENYPGDNIVLYFTDVQYEDEDLYRFIQEGSDALQLPLLTHSKGLNPIELMFEKKLVFNSMIGDCSKELKIKVSNQFIKKGIIPPIEKWYNKQFLKNEFFTDNPILTYGIGFEEFHRVKAIEKNWKGYEVKFPLVDHIIDCEEVLKRYNLKPSRLYSFGFSHNNCKGRCVKAGRSHYKRLKETMPEVYQDILEKEYHMSYYVSAYRYIIDTKIPEEDIFPKDVQEILVKELEDAYRDYFYGRAARPKLYIHPAHTAIPKYSTVRKYSFMKKQVNGVVSPLTIRDFDKMLLEEERLEALKPKQLDLFDIGGCGCFVDFV